MKMWDKTPLITEFEPYIEYYKSENKRTDGAVIIFPGGGYMNRAEHEGKGYAEFLNKNGIDAFVCQYRVNPDIFPAPLLDARRAVRYVRFHSAEYGINPNKIGVMGSSAGGHLAALLCTFRDKIEGEGVDIIDKTDYLPNFQILCYPVISTTDFTFMHYGSMVNLLGISQFNLAQNISPNLIADKNTPKAFIFHTFEDNAVPVRNSLEYAKKLRDLNVSVEMHIFPIGSHGLGLAKDTPHTNQWSGLLINWLYDYCL